MPPTDKPYSCKGSLWPSHSFWWGQLPRLAVSKSLSYRDAVWAANPITVGVGFIAYKWAYHSLHLSDYLADYDGPQSSYCSALHLRLFRPLPLCRGSCATPAPHGFVMETLNCGNQAATLINPARIGDRGSMSVIANFANNSRGIQKKHNFVASIGPIRPPAHCGC